MLLKHIMASRLLAKTGDSPWLIFIDQNVRKKKPWASIDVPVFVGPNHNLAR